jgi:hypothetical protein
MRIAIAVCIVSSACARNVPQDKATSRDGKIKGAKELHLENGAATDTGIVTYPGGDRVDWKKIELPEKKRGALEIKLTWTTPRPNLKLAFDVFDAWNAQVAVSKKSARRTRVASIANATGTYFIRVYAVGRGDAGRYKLGVEFDGREQPVYDPTKIEVMEPPKLVDLPPVVETKACDIDKFDFKNPDCEDKCPRVNAPANWPGCAKVCTVSPPDPAIPACAESMPCPPGGDIRVKRCTKKDFPPCPDPKRPDPRNKNCLEFEFAPVPTRIGRKFVVGDEVEVVIMAGSASNIDATWTAVVLQGNTEKPLPGGKIRILRVDSNVTIGRVKLTPQQIEQNLRVRVTPPPKS